MQYIKNLKITKILINHILLLYAHYTNSNILLSAIQCNNIYSDF